MKQAQLLVFGICLTVLPAFAGIISIQPPSSTVLPGQTFSINVDVSGISDLYAFQFDIGFNPAVISATSITEGSFLASGGATFFIPGAIDDLGGGITFTADTLLGALSGVSGSGVLATVQFNALGAGSSPIALSNVILLDSTSSNINAGVVNGSVNVVPEPSTLSLCAVVFSMLIARSLKTGRRDVFRH